MAPSTSEGVAAGDVEPQAAATTAASPIRARRRITSPEYRALSGRRRKRSATRIGELALELGRRSVAVVDVQRYSVRPHYHRGRQRVHVEPVGESAIGDGVDLVDPHR